MAEIIGILFFIILLFFFKKYREYNNPFRLIMIIGKKGSGKSTTICKLAQQHFNKGWTCYSTEDTPGTYKVEPCNIGYTEFEPNSVLFIDEIGLIWHSRDFKNFAKEVREWFKLQRHRKIKVYCFSQAFDIDKGLRDLCDEIWLIKCYFNIFSVRKKVIKNITVNNNNQTNEGASSGFVDELKILPFIVPGARRFVYIPKYSMYFNSYEARPLRSFTYPFTGVKLFQTRKHYKVQKKLRKAYFKQCSVSIGTKVKTFLYKKGLICYTEPIRKWFYRRYIMIIDLTEKEIEVLKSILKKQKSVQ